MKGYILTEDELRKLIHSHLKLTALESGGVDNWEWYGESLYDFIDNWVKDRNLDPGGDWSFKDIVDEEIDSKYYMTIEM